jgi:mannan endo-1,4-beta-mannosidase
MRKRIIEAYKRGGINTISWHCDNPLTGGNAWDISKNGVVASILPGGEKHELFMTWLDKVANFLNSLESGGKKIPILFRPFHEHTAGWFWWGDSHCTPQEYIMLIRMTADYFKQKGLHNLIYIYSPDQIADPAKYFERYPGDTYMDMLGVDYYQQQGAAGAPQYMQTMDKILAMLTIETKKRNKLLVFSETGLESVPMNNWWTDVLLKTISPYPVTYVMVWRNAYERPNHFFGPYPGHPANSNFIQFYKDSKTLFQGDISKMYK